MNRKVILVMKEKLSCLPENTAGVIVSVGRNTAMHRRLQDLGFVPGTSVRALYAGCCGGIRAYGIHGSVIALRTRDADEILMEV